MSKKTVLPLMLFMLILPGMAHGFSKAQCGKNPTLEFTCCHYNYDHNNNVWVLKPNTSWQCPQESKQDCHKRNSLVDSRHTVLPEGTIERYCLANNSGEPTFN